VVFWRQRASPTALETQPFLSILSLGGETLTSCLVNAQKLLYSCAIACPFTAIEIPFIINLFSIHVGDAYISKCSAAIWI
jgi:hypothetical protein